MCQCYRAGTIEIDQGPPLCDQLTGQCHCKPHVQGVNCDTCEDGYYNIVKGEVTYHFYSNFVFWCYFGGTFVQINVNFLLVSGVRIMLLRSNWVNK